MSQIRKPLNMTCIWIELPIEPKLNCTLSYYLSYSPQFLFYYLFQNLTDCKIYREQKSIGLLSEIRSCVENYFTCITLSQFFSMLCFNHVTPELVSKAKWPHENGLLKTVFFFLLTVVSFLHDLYDHFRCVLWQAAFTRLGRVVFLATSYCYCFECLNHYFATTTHAKPQMLVSASQRSAWSDMWN